MTNFILYAKILLFVAAGSVIAFLYWQNTTLQSKLDNTMIQIGELSGALDTQSVTIDQLNLQSQITQQNMAKVQESSTKIEIDTIQSQRDNRNAISSVNTQNSETASKTITERINTLLTIMEESSR